MSSKKGIVVGVHPEDHSVDILLSDGRRLTGVQVQTPNGSTRSGVFDMPATPAKKNKWDVSKETGQDQIAIVSFVDEMPVVTGFLFPQISQMTFNDGKRKISRHQSDVMHSIDGDGNVQIQHPSGTYIRMGETVGLDDLEKKNTDKNLKIDRNKTRKVNIHIGLAGGAGSVTITPDGSVTFTLAKGFTVNAGGEVNIKGTKIVLDAPLVHNPLGDIVAKTVSLRHHVNTGVMPGGSNTGEPAQ